MAESADNGWKVLIFSRCLRTIEAIESALARTPHVVVTGADTGSRRAARKRAWFTGHDGRAVLIGQIDPSAKGSTRKPRSSPKTPSTNASKRSGTTYLMRK